MKVGCLSHLLHGSIYDVNISSFRVLTSPGCRVDPLPASEQELGAACLISDRWLHVAGRVR